MSGRQLEDEDAEHLIELKQEIGSRLENLDVEVYYYPDANDLIVVGKLTSIVKVYHEYRSEIDEELGQ